MTSDTLALAIQLIQKPSITPNDAGCMSLIIDRLKPLGFYTEVLQFEAVKNLWAKYGTQPPLFVFVGHTDVVPPGPLESWKSPPFEPTIRDKYLYGRGAVDMKGGVAAMVIAVENFLKKYPTFEGSIAFLLTSDEEGPAINGTRKVVEELQRRGEVIDWCVVGEPSSLQRVGDTIRNGRRGSLSCDLTIKGIQGHVAYPHVAQNPIHAFAPLLHQLVNTTWDKGNAFFPATQFQIVHIHGSTGTYNVTPETLNVKFNFRFNSETTAKKLQEKIEQMLEIQGFAYNAHWMHSAEPFLTQSGMLLESLKKAIRDIMCFNPALSTGGGTSDGRFIAPLGAQVVELGLCSRTLHQVNECVAVADLDFLTAIYQKVLENLYSGSR